MIALQEIAERNMPKYANFIFAGELHDFFKSWTGKILEYLFRHNGCFYKDLASKRNSSLIAAKNQILAYEND